MNTCWSHSPSTKEILKPQTQKFTISCKSFVLSICFPLFFCCMTCVMSQLLWQLWYYFTWRPCLGDFCIHASLETPLLPLGEQNSFHSSSQGASEAQVLLTCPSLCESGCDGLFSITWLKPHQTPVGQVGEREGSESLLSCASRGLPKQGRQPAKTVSLSWK